MGCAGSSLSDDDIRQMANTRSHLGRTWTWGPQSLSTRSGLDVGNVLGDEVLRNSGLPIDRFCEVAEV